jgi:LemA protein
VKKFLALAVALAAVAVFFGAKCVTIHKNLLAERQIIDADWTEVDAALQRRAGLIPDLTETVKAQIEADAPTEAAALTAVNDACNLLILAHERHEKIQANAQVDQAIGRLMLLAENYPKLQRGKKYGDLLETLKGAEYQIAVARRKYNEAVEHYNARIELFPDNIVASVSRLHKVDAYFQTPAI